LQQMANDFYRGLSQKTGLKPSGSRQKFLFQI
jgi:hypothetical protein